MRALYYLCMTSLYHDGLSAFKRGIVYVCYEVDGPPTTRMSMKYMRKWGPLYLTFPSKLACCHYCVQKTIIKPWIEAWWNMTPKYIRLRLKFHFGGHMECQYSLLSYGVPDELFMTDQEGNLRHEYIDLWIQRQRDREMKLQQQQLQQQQQQQQQPQQHVSTQVTEETSTATVLDSNMGVIASKPPPTTTRIVSQYSEFEDIIVASDKDVLLGRGVSQKHPGNVRLRQIIEDHFNLHAASSVMDKTMIAWKIVRMIQDGGGRFLDRDKDDVGRWKVISDESARYKVSYGFRSHTKLISRRKRR